MADVVNLKRARKDSARIKKIAKATENAVKFGRTKAQKAVDRQTEDRIVQHLDNHKLDKDD